MLNDKIERKPLNRKQTEKGAFLMQVKGATKGNSLGETEPTIR